jgi:DNA-binding MarR family transcriptional regulator
MEHLRPIFGRRTLSSPRPGSPDVLEATSQGPISQAEYQLIGEFRRAVREFLAFSEEGARAHGITPQQHQALLAIKAHGGPPAMTISDLAQCLSIKNHSAVGLVARLAARDLVARTSSDEDLRRVLLELRPRGEDILDVVTTANLVQLELVGRSLSRLLKTVRQIQRNSDEQGSLSRVPQPK